MTAALAGYDGEPRTERHFDWVACEDRLSAASCAAIIEAAYEFPAERAGSVGEAQHPGRRQATTRKLLPSDRSQWVFERLLSVASVANRRHYGLSLSGIHRPPEYVEYRPGNGRFDWHNDYSHHPTLSPRKLTLVVQLSHPSAYEGGALQTFGLGVQELPREQGSILIFPSFVFHRVTEVTAGERRILVAWIAGAPLR